MRNRCILLLACEMALICFLGGSIALPALAGENPPYGTADYPPRPPEYVPIPAQPLTDRLSSLSLTPLKAVLLVGPIDGDYGDWTLQEVDNMELAADVLEENGVTIYRFYPGDGSTFADIEAAANGAHFLLYRGHGVYDGNLPYPNVGGFSLSSGYYSPDRIRTYMHLAPNAIVMLYGCFTAGSSSAEGDLYDIGIVEAGRRVSQYSDPFFDIGAVGYYANWFGNAFEQFLSNLFAGQTLGQAYEDFFDFNSATVYRTTHLYHPELNMWIDKDYWDGYWQYNNAFAGKHSLTLEDLFPVPTLGGIPTNIDFTVDVTPEIIVQPASYMVTPANISGNEVIDWAIEVSGDWLEVLPTHGTTPASAFTVTPLNYATDKPGEYTGTITVTAESPENTTNPIQVITVNLSVFAPELGGLPAEIRFVYSIADHRFDHSTYLLTPQNTGSVLPMNLYVATDRDWINLSPEEGITPQDFMVTVGDFDPLTAIVYTGTITVTATTLEATPVYASPQIVPVSLYVIDGSFFQSYIPFIFKR
jgi:hypothetical protein